MEVIYHQKGAAPSALDGVVVFVTSGGREKVLDVLCCLSRKRKGPMCSLMPEQEKKTSKMFSVTSAGKVKA